VTLTDQTGRVFTTVAGATETINYTFYGFAIKTSAATNVGTLTIALYREARDIQTSYPAVSINNPIVIIGTVTIAGAVTITNTVSITGTVAISGPVAISGTVTITGAVTISGAVTVTNAIIENATGNLASGLLPTTVLPLTLAPNVVNSVTVPKAIASFALAVLVQDGFLSVFYTFGGQTVYLLRKMPFFSNFSNGFVPVERLYRAPIPAGGNIHVLVEQTVSTATGTLKY
jgi:hypothetical protein